jgi:hypothetical protein
MQVHEVRGSRVPDKADEVAALQACARPNARARCIQVAEDQNVITYLTTLAQGVARHYSGSKERAHVEYLRVSLLVFERYEVHGRALSLRQVYRPVSDLAKPSPSPLQLVGAVEVVAAHHARVLARDRIAVGVVVGRPVWAAWDLVVGDPAPVWIVMAGRGTFGFRSSFFVVGQANAGVPVGQTAGRAARQREERPQAGRARGIGQMK